nr:zinc finger BED domain-containing protein RICESLEEPER 2 [Tanacetum cinerariifolium]
MLRNHITHPHCEALKTVSKARQSSMARDESVILYNLDVFRKAGLVIQQGLPLNHFDNAQMKRVFQNHMQPKYNHDVSTRWNSTYHMFHCGLKQKDSLIYFHDLLADAGFDVLGFSKAKESMFYVLSQMAMDLYSVQATSVASKSDFSTNKMVLSIQRTRLTPASLEMCMCLKDHMDATERIQHTSNLKNALDFEEEILDEQVQQNEVTPLSDEEITLDEAASEARSNVSGSGGEEFDMSLSD